MAVGTVVDVGAGASIGTVAGIGVTVGLAVGTAVAVAMGAPSAGATSPINLALANAAPVVTRDIAMTAFTEDVGATTVTISKLQDGSDATLATAASGAIMAGDIPYSKQTLTIAHAGFEAPLRARRPSRMMPRSRRLRKG